MTEGKGRTFSQTFLVFWESHRMMVDVMVAVAIVVMVAVAVVVVVVLVGVVESGVVVDREVSDMFG